MLKTLLHCMLISTTVLAADNSNPFSAPTASSSKSERVILSEDSGEPSAKKQRVDTPYETMYMFLPDELITHIATFARIKDGIQMGSTCKNWKQVLDQSDIWQRYAPRLAGYEFFKDAPCFKQEDGSIDYKRIIKAATYPFIFIFHKIFQAVQVQSTTSSLLSSTWPYQTKPFFSPIIHKGEVTSTAIPYTFFSTSSFYTPPKTPLVIKNYKEKFESEEVGFYYNIHTRTLEFFEAPPQPKNSQEPENSEDSEEEESNIAVPIFISKNGERIIATEPLNCEPIHIWVGEEGKRTYQSIQGTASKVLNDGKAILLEYNNQAYVWTEKNSYALESLNKGDSTLATDSTSDRSIIVGRAADGSQNNESRAVKWTNEIIQPLEILNGYNTSEATAVSADGDIIIGNVTDGAANNPDRAVKWTNGIIQPLETLNEEKESSEARAISADGNIIIGQITPLINPETIREFPFAREPAKAVMWTSRGVKDLTLLLKKILPKETTLTLGQCINADGSFINGKMSISERTGTYSAFVPREDILEKEGLRAHF